LTPGGPQYCFSQRADHLWEATSSATTRSRPIINTRDEPHADPDLYRRLHVISGDSSMSETTTLLKVGMTGLVLRMLEAGRIFPELAVENPVRALRETSPDISGRAPVTMADGSERTAIDLQQFYLDRAREFVAGSEPARHDEQVLELWSRGLTALETGDLSLIERDLDWAIKKRLVDRYTSSHDLPLSDPRVRRLDLAYHDISRTDGLFARLQQRGLATTVVTEEEITAAIDEPPQTTRAKLRGEFVQAATARRRDYTVDWVHLKLNDHAGRTVLCRDPFATEDDRVAALIASMTPPSDPLRMAT